MTAARWAARLSRGGELRRALGALRARADIECLPLDDVVWLRGDELGRELDRALRAVPGLARFRRDADDTLTNADGGRVPVGRLPEGDWQGIRDAVVCRPAAPAFAGRMPRGLALRLVRSRRQADANVLLTTFDAWHDWALRAPTLRLGRLEFALASDRRVLVRGSPLPPIHGRRFVARDGVAAPAGLEWSPSIDADVVAESLELADGDLAVLLDTDDASCVVERVDSTSFVRATRRAVRASDARDDSEWNRLPEESS